MLSLNFSLTKLQNYHIKRFNISQTLKIFFFIYFCIVKRILQILFVFSAVVMLAACSVSNYIPDGEYYLKEVSVSTDDKMATKGYNLNSYVYEVTTPAAQFSAAGALTSPTDGMLVYSTAIPNTKSELPQTGGAGTLMFTIIGGALVLLAGALFVIIMKKRSSK